MTAPELKPCPFCGGEAVALTGPVKTLWGVTCLRCACWMDDRADTADEAIAAWNRRADLAAVPAQVRVKPLVWDEDGHGNFRAQSVRGGEGVDRIIEPQVIGDDRVTYEAWGIKDSFDDLSAACAAVEAEILSEILAAIEPQPDPRDAVIGRLTQRLETAHNAVRSIERDEETARGMLSDRDAVIARLVEALENRLHDQECPCNACSPMLAALAAAKAVQK